MTDTQKDTRERCKCCGCYLGFAMGTEGDGDFVCNNANCKVNTEDFRSNYEPDELKNELENMEYDLLFRKKKLKDNAKRLFDLVQAKIEEAEKRGEEAINTDKVTRVEVIDHTKDFEEGGGRAYVNWKDTNKVELSFQDDERTLKVFISNQQDKQE